ncbi:Hypothetical protein D9617_35g089650 [Elsinoe fawcettii]|nr:Hypothetical protein D9617_35g089650 [Elsinoe fawcettii]
MSPNDSNSGAGHYADQNELIQGVTAPAVDSAPPQSAPAVAEHALDVFALADVDPAPYWREGDATISSLTDDELIEIWVILCDSAKLTVTAKSDYWKEMTDAEARAKMYNAGCTGAWYPVRAALGFASRAQ